VAPLGAVEPLRGIAIRRVECTINESGDHAGKTTAVEIAIALETCQDFYGPTTDLSSAFLQRASTSAQRDRRAAWRGGAYAEKGPFLRR
jgi:hypothetical protein